MMKVRQAVLKKFFIRLRFKCLFSRSEAKKAPNWHLQHSDRNINTSASLAYSGETINLYGKPNFHFKYLYKRRFLFLGQIL